MDFQLIPICSEIDHEMIYKYRREDICDICNKSGISLEYLILLIKEGIRKSLDCSLE